MDSTSLTGLLWQVCLIEAIICMILLLGVALTIGKWRMAVRQRMAEADRRAGALKRFSSAMAESAIHLKRRTSTIPEIISNTISSIAKRRQRQARILKRFSVEFDKYAAQLNNHNGAIQGLSEVSQDLKEAVNRQRKVISDLLTVIKRAPSGVKPRVEPMQKPVVIREPILSPEVVSEQAPTVEEELIAKIKKEVHPPGHFQYHQQLIEEQKIEKYEIAAKETPIKKPSLATRHTLATKEVIANKAHLISMK